MKHIAFLTLILLVLVSQGLRLVAHVHARPTAAKRIAEESHPHIHLHSHDHHNHACHDHSEHEQAEPCHQHDRVPCNPVGACPCDHHSDALYISDVNLFRDAESAVVVQTEWSFGYQFVNQMLVCGTKRIVAEADPPSLPKCPVYLQVRSLRL